jgi:hypothetical protein
MRGSKHMKFTLYIGEQCMHIILEKKNIYMIAQSTFCAKLYFKNDVGKS